ncbi:hypothetical protein [Pseudonocardia spinosispora]|uniref:hypothetical protein n=1 Tax=Pseudonocardia spinosispora TaxID=103441 RepID=UPI0004919CDB|nr:hypothetical protein [Pseudonocardia spinosispora]
MALTEHPVANGIRTDRLNLNLPAVRQRRRHPHQDPEALKALRRHPGTDTRRHYDADGWLVFTPDPENQVDSRAGQLRRHILRRSRGGPRAGQGGVNALGEDGQLVAAAFDGQATGTSPPRTRT